MSFPHFTKKCGKLPLFTINIRVSDVEKKLEKNALQSRHYFFTNKSLFSSESADEKV